MLPTQDELARISKSNAGQLSDVPFASLLVALFRKRRDVVIELRRLQLRKQLVLEEGVPVDCRSNLLHETLGKLMVRGKQVDEEAYQRALETADDLRLSARHARVLLPSMRRARIDELQQTSGLEPDETARLVYALALLCFSCGPPTSRRRRRLRRSRRASDRLYPSSVCAARRLREPHPSADGRARDERRRR